MQSKGAGKLIINKQTKNYQYQQKKIILRSFVRFKNLLKMNLVLHKLRKTRLIIIVEFFDQIAFVFEN